MPGHRATPIRRGPGCLWAKAGSLWDVGSFETVALTQQWVLTRLMGNAERALQHVAVLDKERKPTGEYRYDGSVANRALELLGKQQGCSSTATRSASLTSCELD